MEISAQNPATQTVNPYDADKVAEKRDEEKNAIKVRDAKEDEKAEERKVAAELEAKKKALEAKKREDAAQSEAESIDEAYAKDKKEEDSLKKISVYA